MNTNVEPPRVSRVEREVLRTLIGAGRRPLYGLEILRATGKALTRGSLYTTLDRMEEKGFVASRREDTPSSEYVPVEQRLPRRLFTVTALGQAALRADDVMRATFAAEMAHGAAR